MKMLFITDCITEINFKKQQAKKVVAYSWPQQIIGVI